VPSSDPCTAGGYAYLYILDYLCRDLGTTDPLAKSGFSKQTTFDFETLAAKQYGVVKSTDKNVGVVAKLGVGMPSRPVLDSSSLYIFVQTSVAEIHRIKVDLLEKPVYMMGWKEDE
jgi:type IV pilus assembly protein PilY1